MASIVNNITYNGKYAASYYTAALMRGPSLATFKGLPTVKSKEIITKLTLAGLLQEDNCAWDNAGTITMDPRTVEVCPMKINKDLCYEDFETAYESELMRPGYRAEIPTSFSDFLLTAVQAQLADDLENIAWNGNTGLTSGVTSLCDGFLTLFGVTGSGVVSVTGASGGLTLANILPQMAVIYAAIPGAVLFGATKPKIYMGVAAAALLSAAVAENQNVQYGNYIESPTLQYLGLEVVVSNRMPVNNIVVANPENLWYAYDVASENTTVAIQDAFPTQFIRKAMLYGFFKVGFQFAIGAEIVWYH